MLSLIAWVIYYPATQAGILWDDKLNFIEDPLMKAEDGLRKIWLNPKENNNVWPYLPISRTSFWLEHRLWGFHLGLSHLTNVIFHLMGAIVLWLVMRQLQVRGAWWIGLLFLCHPIYVQSVAWITERKNVLAGVFYLLTIWSYLQFDRKRQWSWYFLTLGLFICALFSKASTTMLPVIFIFCRLWLGRSWNQSHYWSLVPFFILSLGNAYSRIWFELNSFGASAGEFSRSFIERLLSAGIIPFFYLKKIIIPYPLSFIYPKWEIDSGDVSHYLPLLSLVLIAGLLLWKYRSWGSPLFCGWGAFLASLFPVLGFFNNAWTRNSFVADHWVHLPSISILILSAQGIFKIMDNSRLKRMENTTMRVVCLGGIPMLLGGLTWHRTQTFQDLETLFQDTVQKNPKAAAAYLDLGVIYAGQGKHQLANRYYDQALKLTPNRSEIYNDKSLSFLALKQYQKALEFSDQAIALKEDSEYYSNRGGIFLYLKEYEKALENFNRAIELDKSNPKPYTNRYQLFLVQNQHRKAISDLTKLISLKVNVLEYTLQRSKIYADSKDFQKAIEDLTSVIENFPSFEQLSSLFFFRGNFRIELQQYHKAVEDYDNAVRLGFQSAILYNNRGFAHKTLHQYPKALADFSEAIRLDPRFARSYQHRAAIYRKQNQRLLACGDWKKACELKACEDFDLARMQGECE
ncbi:MAG: tetratricopeptide repeat protein [SAR324 cluster bacterium]|nr:tetratricopeptide repeat protein [SAR324 cluster bacterium]